MSRNDLIDAMTPGIVALRHDIHRHPELGFEEHRTADIVARRLTAAGLEVHRDLTETTVVGVLRSGSSARRVMFRAELDALPIEEKSRASYSSTVTGRMHACGHDGHASILVGAAELLARTRGFDGTIVFLFQPAEEVHGGADRVLKAGLLDRFPVDAVYAWHNWPGLPEGQLVVGAGPRMAAVDDFTILFRGRGAHAAMPEQGDDPILAAAEFMTSAQRIVSRTIDPQSALVVSITQVHGGSINNVVPGEVRVEGTCRFFAKSHSNHAEAGLQRIAAGLADAHGVSCEMNYHRGYPAVINPASGAAAAAEAAGRAGGEQNIARNTPASMGCEDFAYLLNAVGEGAYIWIGAGEAGPGEGLHGDRYVFNDRLVPLGLSYWHELAAVTLPLGQP